MNLNCCEGERWEFVGNRREVGVCTVVYFGKERSGSLHCCLFWERERWDLLCRREVGVYTVVYFGQETGGNLSICSVM